MDLSEMRTLVRRDLKDEDPSAYRWTDAELDRHILHAVHDLSLATPLEAKTTLSTTAGSRDLSIIGVTDLVRVEAVEYPVDLYPAAFVRFRVWAGTLTLLVDALPADGETVRLFFGKLHVLDATSSTLPAHAEDTVAVGAGAYAALEWASFATNRVNLGGPDTWRQYLAWGQQRLDHFQRALGRLAARNAVRARHLYVAAAPQPSQSTDWGP
jgi:hypothetical protein